MKAVLFYIHYNPQKHGLCRDFREYKYSSYSRFITEKVTKIKKDEVINWFNGKENFIEYQSDMQNSKAFNEIEAIEI